MAAGGRTSVLARLVLALMICAAALPTVAVAQQQTDPSPPPAEQPQPAPTEPTTPTGNPFVLGIAAHAWWLDPEVYGDQLFPALDDLQVTTVRLGIDWKRFEETPGVYDWSMYDRVLGELARRNIVVVANFNTIPAWASVDFEGCADGLEINHCQLREDMYPAFERSVEAALARYAWIEHWEYWNEPEMWVHLGQSGPTYLRMLKTFYDTAHRINPEVTVAAQTLVGSEYMEFMYNLSDVAYGKGNEPWDAISFHPYNFEYRAGSGERPLEINYDRVVWLRDLMVAREDGDKKIWITEYGWYLDEQQQAQNLPPALDWLQAQPYIAFAHIHMLHDWTNEPGQVFGLMEIVPDENGERFLGPDTEFRPKELFYNAFKNYPLDLPGRRPSDPNAWIVPETGHSVEGRFLKAWQERGGLEILGFPLTRPYYRQQDDGSWLLVQDFERMRFEFHPEHVGTPFEVLGQLMGSITASGKFGDPPFQLLAACQSTPDRLCFEETGHAISGGFKRFWESRGGLVAFGYPLSGEFIENGLTVQYFERVRMEYHGNGLILLGALVRDELHEVGWMGPGSLIETDIRTPTRRQFR